MIPETSKKHLWALPICLIVFLVLELTNWFGWNEFYYHDTWYKWSFTLDPFYGQLIFSTVIVGLLAIFFEIQQTRKQDGTVSWKDKVADVLVTVSCVPVAFAIIKSIFLLV